MRRSVKKAVWVLAGCSALGLVEASCGDAQAAHYTHSEPEKPPILPPLAPDELPSSESSGPADNGNVTVPDRVRIRSRILYGTVWVQTTSLPMPEDEARQAMLQMHRDVRHRAHEITLLRQMTVGAVRSNGSQNFVESLRDLLRRMAEQKKHPGRAVKAVSI